MVKIEEEVVQIGSIDLKVMKSFKSNINAIVIETVENYERYVRMINTNLIPPSIR